MTSKTCTQCRKEMPLAEFRKDNRRKDGRGSKCKPCTREIARAWEVRTADSRAQKRRVWREANKERLAQYSAEYRLEHYDDIRARKAAYRQENAEKVRESSAGTYARNGEKYNAKVRARRAANPHIGWLLSYRERCRKFSQPAVSENFTKADVIERYGDRCAYCETGAFEELDHYLPVSKGGPHTLDNVRPACAPCNLAKWSTPGVEWDARGHDRWTRR